ncbi:MAG: tetratricopeptide repeat protein [Gallionella sp.]|nr:tetratricopeptide repeat protein [Gallionella sp.]
MHTLLVAAYLVTRSLVLGTTEQWNSLDLSRFARVVDFVLGYSEMLVFPSQIPFYIQPPQHPVSSALGWISAIAIAALAGFSWRAFDPDRKKALIFSAVWVVAFSWPAALIMLYMDGYYAARFMYVPATGVAIFASIFYSHVIAAYPSLKAVAMVSFALIIAFYGAITLKEIPSWHDDGAIYGKITRVAPESADGHFGLGHYQMRQEDYAPAEKNFLIALQKTRAPTLRANTLVALGTIYEMTSKLQQSERYLIEAIQIEPDNSEALARLGNLALMQGQISLAIYYYEKALAARPGNYEAAMNLVMAYEKINQPERAELIRRTTH